MWRLLVGLQTFIPPTTIAVPHWCTAPHERESITAAGGGDEVDGLYASAAQLCVAHTS